MRNYYYRDSSLRPDTSPPSRPPRRIQELREHMRLLVDLLGAPAQSGGMRLYSEQLVLAWHEAFPQDELVLVGDRWLRESFCEDATLRLVTLPADGTLSRLAEKLLIVPFVYVSSKFHGVLSVSPVVSPLIPRHARFAVVHDWRHMKNPDEFGMARRFYRRLWSYSCRTAAIIINISDKTELETREYAPGANSVVIENGHDHPRRWPPVEDAPDHQHLSLVTFGHHTNKRPELVVRALAHLRPELLSKVALTVLGANGKHMSDLRNLAQSLSVAGQCHFEGFVSDSRYQEIIQKASAIVLMSSDEGFGLPIAEAAFFGIPCVVASDSGVAELHGGRTEAADPDPAAVAVALDRAINGKIVFKPHRGPTWGDTARSIRQLISNGSPS